MPAKKKETPMGESLVVAPIVKKPRKAAVKKPVLVVEQILRPSEKPMDIKVLRFQEELNKFEALRLGVMLPGWKSAVIDAVARAEKGVESRIIRVPCGGEWDYEEFGTQVIRENVGGRTLVYSKQTSYIANRSSNTDFCFMLRAGLKFNWVEEYQFLLHIVPLEGGKYRIVNVYAQDKKKESK